MSQLDRPESPTRSGLFGLAEMQLRFASAIVLAFLALAGAWLGGWAAILVCYLVAAAVLVEWRGVTGAPGAAPVTGLLLALLAAAVVAAGLGQMALWLALVLGGAALASVAGREAWNGLGLVYAGLFAGCLLAIRLDPGYGLVAVVFVLVVVWITDTAAYLVGRRLGGPKLWPRLSPNKTWSGFVGGSVGGIAAGLAAAAIAEVPVTFRLFLVAIGLSLASHGGDLLESALKRRFGVKDAGRLIPGHGGMMDRIDGLIMASIVAAAIGFLHADESRLGQGLLQW